jgi:NADPH:quinone reductase-like Zn-dependent oxidoreductase
LKAARIHAYGDPDQLRVEEVDDPVAGPRDLLIRVHASSVNPVDAKIRSGSQRGAVRLKLPWILGMDVSGVVEAVGEQVEGFAVGDEVYASPTHRRPGTYAELVAIEADAVAAKPETLTHVEAASLPLVGLTAWDCLVGAAKLEAGETVLIQAGAGGVGTVAVQLARALGARVATTCSGRNVDFVRELGADVAIDYTETKFEEAIDGCDVVLESMGGAIHGRSLKVLRRGGRLVSINSGLPAATARWGPNLALAAVGLRLLGRKIAGLGRGVKVSTVVRKPSGAHLAELAALVDAGEIRPVVAEVFPLERIADAHRAIETGRTRGKNVIQVRSG